MSQNQLLFLQVEKKRKLLIRISRILVLLGFLAIWEILSMSFFTVARQGSQGAFWK